MQRSIGGVRFSRVGLSREKPTNEIFSEAEIFDMDGVLSRLIFQSQDFEGRSPTSRCPSSANV